MDVRCLYVPALILPLAWSADEGTILSFSIHEPMQLNKE
jgi:hypothetical protein